jgi:hypothetical protein
MNNLPYTAGTVSIPAGSNTATGSGTVWTDARVQPWGFLTITETGQVFVVETIDSATGLTLVNKNGGAAITGAAYTIISFPSEMQDSLNIQAIRAFLATASMTIYRTSNPTAGDGIDGTACIVNDGTNPLTVWTKAAGAWTQRALGVSSAGISDATTVGKALITAADAVGARSAAGAGLTPIVIWATGQSNMSRYEDYSWAPPANLLLWNYDPMIGDPTVAGSQFEAVPNDKISVSWSFAAELALANPLRKIYLVNTARGGEPIACWLPGGSPDMFACGQANMEAALDIVGADFRLIHLWWQGEADVSSATYESDFGAYRSRIGGLSWYKTETPIVLFGVSPYMTGATADAMRKFNKVLSKCAAASPEKMPFIYTGSFGSTYWEPTVDYLHMTAEGYSKAGKLAFGAMERGLGRPTLDTIVIDPLTKQLLQPQKYYFRGMSGPFTGPADITYSTTPADNTGGAFNAGTGVFTVPLSGLWTIEYTIAVSPSAGATSTSVYLNGANAANGSGLATPSIADLVSSHGVYTSYFNEGDLVKLHINSGTIIAARFSMRFCG